MHQSQASNLHLVSVSVLRRLLRNNEAVLLYPGGVREAYKNKDEKYQVMAGSTQCAPALLALCSGRFGGARVVQ